MHFLASDLPNSKIATSLRPLLLTSLALLVQFQHALARASERRHQFTHTTCPKERICKTILLVSDYGSQLHTTHEAVATDHVCAGAENSVVGDDDLWEETRADLGEVLCFGFVLRS